MLSSGVHWASIEGGYAGWTSAENQSWVGRSSVSRSLLRDASLSFCACGKWSMLDTFLLADVRGGLRRVFCCDILPRCSVPLVVHIKNGSSLATAERLLIFLRACMSSQRNGNGRHRCWNRKLADPSVILICFPCEEHPAEAPAEAESQPPG